jgi:hypothetical protein
MAFRVSQEFTLSGDPPTQEATDRLRERFNAIAPQSGAILELGVGRMLVTMTFDATDADSAAAMAKAASSAVLASSAVRIEVEALAAEIGGEG